MSGYSGSSPSEPMTLGSPSSPNTPPTGSSQYLPGYLTGATTPAIPPSSSFWSVSSPAGRSSIPQYVTNLQTNDLSLLSKTPRNIHGQTPRGKPGVPPVQELFDGISSPVSNYPIKNVATPQKSMVHDKMINATFDSGNLNNSILTPSRSFNQTTNNSYFSPAQIDPFYTQGENLSTNMQLDETWVTVFGFPSAAASYILQQFSQYGTVLEHKMATSGNWMHIHYETKLQAKKAIGKNGKIFGKTIMIGVTQCIEKEIMDESVKENSLCSSAISPFLSSESNGHMSQGTIRPLTQAYKTAASTHKVTPQTRTPQKNNNVISKAMEYIFSW